jgi:hypothetical protein
LRSSAITGKLAQLWSDDVELLLEDLVGILGVGYIYLEHGGICDAHLIELV